MPASDNYAGPSQHYQHLLQTEKLTHDSAQSAAVDALQLLYDNLQAAGMLAPKQPRLSGFVSKFFTRQPKAPIGLYLFGGVGRGKTMLMDLFYGCLDAGVGQRFHFHDFMVRAHHLINTARRNTAADPIADAADQLMADGNIICFDEMEVRDIADAMIIKRLFDCLWQRQMVLIATSNRHPDSLYLNGLHRDRFTPFISSLSKNTGIHHIEQGQDWRQKMLKGLPAWHLTTLPETPATLDMIFSQITGMSEVGSEQIEIAGRHIEITKCAGDIADTDFDSLCAIPLAAPDYLAIANRFAGLMIRDIPVLTDSLQNEARRFMWLVDALYDRGRFLIVSADADIENLYCGHQWEFEFDRTSSRLKQMAQFSQRQSQNIR